MHERTYRGRAPARRRRPLILFAAATAAAVAGFTGLGSTAAMASSHREAPLISGLPKLDNTDVYAFQSPDHPNMTTIIANWIPLEEPAGGPNFYPFQDGAHYDVLIDNNGDAKPDITYRWVFSSRYLNKNTFLYNTGPVTSLNDPDLNFRQSYDLYEITKSGTKELLHNAPVAPSDVGKASMPDYATLMSQAVRPLQAGETGNSFTGQADDPFFLDLRVFDLLYGGNLSEVGDDTLAGFNVNSIALQVPSSDLTASGDPVIGIWSTTSKKSSDGEFAQVSRLGNPLVNEVVIPVKDKDKFNASKPADDAQFLKYVTNPILPPVIQKVYGIPAPKTPRNDLVSVFLTGIKGLNMPKHLTAPGEELRLNTSIKPTAHPNRLGVLAGDKQGFPNGRRLTDDVIDIELQVVEGELVGHPNNLGDAVNQNDKPFMSHFPYVAAPTSGSNPKPHEVSTGRTALTGGNYAPPSHTPFRLPVAPLTGAGLAALLAGAGVLSLRRERRKATVAHS